LIEEKYSKQRMESERKTGVVSDASDGSCSFFGGGKDERAFEKVLVEG